MKRTTIQSTTDFDWIPPSRTTTLDSRLSVRSDGITAPNPIPMLPTDPEKEKKLYLVEGSKLIDLCSSCPECKNPVIGDSVRLISNGTAPTLHIACRYCWQKSRPVQKWNGQSMVDSGDRMFHGNFALTSAAITGGLKYAVSIANAGISKMTTVVTYFQTLTSFPRKSSRRIKEENKVNVH